jgi:hemolysin III
MTDFPPAPVRCPVSDQSATEEAVNCVTHGFGLAASVAGLVTLVLLASMQGSARHIFSCGLYGVTLVLLYGASTWYHGCRCVVRKRILKRVDHSCIYLLIAGSYTPFTFGPLHGPYGWSLFAIVWSLAVAGILLQVFRRIAPEWLSTLMYLAMGWMVLFAIGPLRENLSPGGIYWIVAGGVAYTVGVVFYLWQRLPFAHGIWHLFTLAGSACHFISVMLYVIPRG